MFNFCRRENVLTTQPHKGTQDNLVKTKGWCEFCHEKFEISRCAGLQLQAFKSFQLYTLSPQKQLVLFFIKTAPKVQLYFR